MNRLQTGDRVVVRTIEEMCVLGYCLENEPDEEASQYETVVDVPCSFVQGMVKYIGQKATITYTSCDITKLDIDHGDWNWSSEMLRLVSPNKIEGEDNG